MKKNKRPQKQKNPGRGSVSLNQHADKFEDRRRPRGGNKAGKRQAIRESMDD